VAIGISSQGLSTRPTARSSGSTWRQVVGAPANSVDRW